MLKRRALLLATAVMLVAAPAWAQQLGIDAPKAQEGLIVGDPITL